MCIRDRLSADQSGTLMHWVLQMALDPHPGPDNPCAALQPYLEPVSYTHLKRIREFLQEHGLVQGN